MTILLPLLICLVGALVYLLSKDSKRAELGRLAFGIGLFFTVAEFAPKVVSFFGK